MIDFKRFGDERARTRSFPALTNEANSDVPETPATLTEAERVNWLKVVDVTRAGDAWKATLVAKDWQNQSDYGKDFEAFLAAQKKDITATLVSLGLA